MSFGAESDMGDVDELRDAESQASGDSRDDDSGLAASLRSSDQKEAESGGHSKLCAHLIRMKAKPEAALNCLKALRAGQYGVVTKFAGRYGAVDQQGLAEYIEYCGLDINNDVAELIRKAQRSMADRVADLEVETEEALKGNLGSFE